MQPLTPTLHAHIQAAEGGFRTRPIADLQEVYTLPREFARVLLSVSTFFLYYQRFILVSIIIRLFTLEYTRIRTFQVRMGYAFMVAFASWLFYTVLMF